MTQTWVRGHPVPDVDLELRHRALAPAHQPFEASLFALQRQAGNAAVAGLLGRRAAVATIQRECGSGCGCASCRGDDLAAGVGGRGEAAAQRTGPADPYCLGNPTAPGCPMSPTIIPSPPMPWDVGPSGPSVGPPTIPQLPGSGPAPLPSLPQGYDPSNPNTGVGPCPDGSPRNPFNFQCPAPGTPPISGAPVPSLPSAPGGTIVPPAPAPQPGDYNVPSPDDPNQMA